MNEQSCPKCGAKLPPEVNFCRQCGTAVAAQVRVEPQTVQLDLTSENTATRRLHSRPRSPKAGFPADTPDRPGDIARSPTSPPARRKAPVALVTLVLVLFAACLIAWSAFVRPKRTASTAGSDQSLIYPNSRIILNNTSSSGRAIQLQTDEPSDQVASWYTTTIKPTKTVQLTPTTVVLKSETVTVTIASDDKTTTVLIKQSFPQ